MANKHAIGIDLGTTNCVVARVSEAHHTEIVRDAVGNLLVPSTVLLDDQKVFVGEEAKLRGAGKPDRLVTRAKSQMGHSAFAPPVRGLSLPPEVIQACILNALRENIVRRVGPEFGTVIAVPSFFGDPQRKATADAGAMAGLDVLDLINEPVAAVLAASEHSGLLTPDADPEAKRYVVVYDLGGYTFEATLLEIQAGGLRTLLTSYEENLGGHDWDKRLADHLAEMFIKQHHVDPTADPPGLQYMLGRAARIRHTLSLRPRAPASVSYAGKSLETKVGRDVFSQITADLVARTAELTQNLLTAAGLKWPQISRILLVGGATRMPTIRHMLRQLTGREPDHSMHPDEAVARGAAIYASHLLAMAGAAEPAPRFRVTNLSARSLGIEGVDQRSGKKVNRVLIPRGTPLPARASEKFVTKASAQKTITITLLEGENSDPGGCTTIGRAVIRNLPAEVTEEWPVDVTCEYTAGGRIQMDAQVRYTDRKVHLELVRTVGLSNEKIKRWREVITSGAGFAGFQAVLEGERSAPIALASDRSEPETPPLRRPTRIAAAVAAAVLVGYYLLCWAVPGANLLRLPVPGNTAVESPEMPGEESMESNDVGKSGSPTSDL